MKIRWKLGDRPTGRFKSFQKRGWPMGTINGQPVAILFSAGNNGYQSYRAEVETLIVGVADYRSEDPGFTWRRLKARPIGITAAKELAAKFLEENKDWLP